MEAWKIRQAVERAMVRAGFRHPIGLDERARSAFEADLLRELAPVIALPDLLREIRDACLFVDDDGTIGVTSEPTIDSDLFDRLCARLKALADPQ